LIIADGEYISKRIVERLNAVGYASYIPEAPGNNYKVYMHLLENWPTFLVTPELFSGQALVRMDLAVMLGRLPDQRDAVALETMMAYTKCTNSAIIVPPEHRPIVMMSEVYLDIPLNMPIRV
jgi:hypothetical protein